MKRLGGKWYGSEKHQNLLGSYLFIYLKVHIYLNLPALGNEYKAPGIHQLCGSPGLTFCKLLGKWAKAREQPWLVQSRTLSPAWHTTHPAAKQLQRAWGGPEVATSFWVRLDVFSPGKKEAGAAPRMGASRSHSGTL